MMTIQSKRELLKAMHPRYLKANKAQKTQILDEFVAATGYHRKYATSLLKRGPRPPRLKKKVGRKKTYKGEVIKTLEHIWEICGRIWVVSEIVCKRQYHGEDQRSSKRMAS